MQTNAQQLFPILEDAREDEFISLCEFAADTLPPNEMAELLTGVVEIAARFRH